MTGGKGDPDEKITRPCNKYDKKLILIKFDIGLSNAKSFDFITELEPELD